MSALDNDILIRQPELQHTGIDQPVTVLLKDIIESPRFDWAIITVIIISAISLGLETWPYAVSMAGSVLLWIDRVALLVFTVEMLAKLWVYRQRFFTSGWNIFDISIVAISWIPSIGPLAVLRALRILRVLRLISVVPQMRTVVGALFKSLPGMVSVIAVLMLIFYVSAVISTKLFGQAFPQWFGGLGESMYTLFQIMTLESWSMGIVRPVMDVYPLSWLFFVPFVMITSFAVLNLFIALIVNSMQTVHMRDRDETAHAEAMEAHQEREALLSNIDKLAADITSLRAELALQRSSQSDLKP